MTRRLLHPGSWFASPGLAINKKQAVHIERTLMDERGPLGRGMAHYRAYLLDHDHHVISVANLQCADEQEARERAQQLVDVNDIELWQLDRRIAVFEAATSRTSQATGQGRSEQAQRPANK
ncbi:hypothetical protein [Bradyrhizobium sp. Cp5.3]|uniref:hypothetical protein n=1 Tax=Bradyrhizobium sp. Cp5.3 TaxID=443598 RepID=UPI001FD9A1ED|nr:hypothetical protein [Bradyrhizobium sp. Cp5.3]